MDRGRRGGGEGREGGVVQYMLRTCLLPSPCTPLLPSSSLHLLTSLLLGWLGATTTTSPSAPMKGFSCSMGGEEERGALLALLPRSISSITAPLRPADTLLPTRLSTSESEVAGEEEREELPESLATAW